MMKPEQFLQMTFVTSRIETDDSGIIYRVETRIDELTGLKLTQRFPVPILAMPARVERAIPQ